MELKKQVQKKELFFFQFHQVSTASVRSSQGCPRGIKEKSIYPGGKPALEKSRLYLRWICLQHRDISDILYWFRTLSFSQLSKMIQALKLSKDVKRTTVGNCKATRPTTNLMTWITPRKLTAPKMMGLGKGDSFYINMAIFGMYVKFLGCKHFLSIFPPNKKDRLGDSPGDSSFFSVFEGTSKCCSDFICHWPKIRAQTGVLATCFFYRWVFVCLHQAPWNSLL